MLDATQEAGIVFELIKPVFLGCEADQHTSRFSVARNDDLFALGFAQKTGEIMLDLG
jgi:hypothetical protein